MAQLWATGDVGLWAGVGSGNAPLFVGHGMKAPRITKTPRFRDVECDLGGGVPFDTLYVGETARVSVNLVRYNESTLALIQDRVGRSNGITGSARGIDMPGEIGSLMLTEGWSFSIYLKFAMSVKAAYRTGIPGYTFYSAFVAGPDDIEVGSTNPKTVNLTFTCLRSLDMTVSNAAGKGKFYLYTTTIPANLTVD